MTEQIGRGLFTEPWLLSARLTNYLWAYNLLRPSHTHNIQQFNGAWQKLEADAPTRWRKRYATANGCGRSSIAANDRGVACGLRSSDRAVKFWDTPAPSASHAINYTVESAVYLHFLTRGDRRNVRGGSSRVILLLLPFYDPLSGTTRVSRYQKYKPFWILLNRYDGVAVASDEPYASYLHFAPEDNHASNSSVRLLWAGCCSWHPTASKHCVHIFRCFDGCNTQ